MLRHGIFRLAVLALVLSPISIRMAFAESPSVPAFERIFSEFVDVEEGQRRGVEAHGGQLLITELNCVGCHRAGDLLGARSKSAPILTLAGKRVQPDHLTAYLLDPQGVQPGATMPQILERLPKAERKIAAQALTQYLVHVAGGIPTQGLPRFGDGQMGRQLFETVGCLACHDSPKNKQPLRTSKPLGNLQGKYTLPGLVSFLKDPHAVRPSGRMPSLQLDAIEARRIAAFLLELPEVAAVKVSYYEGSWQKLPDFTKLKPVFVDGVDDIHIKYAKRENQFALRFEGQLFIERPGEYTFHLKSDDGSRLTISDKVVVDHDGVHSETSKSGKATLEAGAHNVIVDVFEQGGGQLILAEFEGPGVKRTQLHTAMVNKNDALPGLPPLHFKTDLQLIDKGRKLYASMGCASCHDLVENGRLVNASSSAKPLAELRLDKGCLSAKPAAPAVDYRLRNSQLDSIRSALADWGVKRVAAISIGHSLAAYNCYACHSRGGFGGVETDRNAYFKGSIPEMGDEGRVPPLLDGIGAKLTDAWLRRILTEGANDRPYMLTRMPKFGNNNVGHLHGQLQSADLPQLAKPSKIAFSESPSEVKKVGRRLVGDKGFSCVKCHTFGRFPATGIQSIDLRTMAQRLRPDWVRQYLRNPQVFRPRTRMPTAWPLEGKSLFEEIYDGNSEHQIAAVWRYLADGLRAKPPAGLEFKTLELIPIDEAIVYRNFIQGAGSRAIGVGYPEGVNQAWDANEMRLALLWQGRFIDASRHWTGRGQGYQPPAGDKLLTMPPHASVAVLPSADAQWPTQPAKEIGQRFLGYRLGKDQRPTFLYSVQGAQVAEFLDTEVQDASTVALRRFTIDASDDSKRLWIRLAVGDEIRQDDGGWYVIDGGWKTRVRSTLKPLVRESAGRTELLAPIEPGGKRTVEQDFAW